MSTKNSSRWKPGHIPHNKGVEQVIIPEDIKQQIIEDYLSGLTFKQAAKKHGYKPGKVYMFLKSKGLMRTNGEAHKGHPTSEETKRKISDARKNHPVSKHTREAVSRANKQRTKEQIRIQVTKAWLTKKVNHTENTSKPEEDFYKKLLQENKGKTIYRNYIDRERYPYHADFYIVEDDLFIELNLHWTHGGHPFNEFNPKDQKKLSEWKQKATTSKFYQQAIYVWTTLDVKKQKTAKDNNLNYVTIY